MMYDSSDFTSNVDRNLIEEYPFDGEFYQFEEADKDLPLDEQVESEVVVLETKCDIQEVSSTNVSGIITSNTKVYFPFDEDEDVPVRKGMMFRGSKYGVPFEGVVVGVDPTMLHGCSVSIREFEV